MQRHPLCSSHRRFDATGALLPGDDARIARIAAAVSRRGAPVRRVTLRARWTALLIAAAIGLLSAGAAGARLWLRHTRDAQIATVAFEKPVVPELSTSMAPSVATGAAIATVPAEPTPTADRPSIASETPNETSSAPRSGAARPSASAMLAKANDARHGGDVEVAVSLYRLLQQEFPSTPESQLSRVSLGRLLLERGRASAALEQFDRYLATTGGPLAAEALSGRARALGVLNRQHEERDTWNRLLREFPGSVYAARARKRLTELE